MANHIREWMMPAAWFVAGVFATGSFWYFLSQWNYFGTGLSAIGAIFFAGVAIYLHRLSDRSVLNAPHRRRLAIFLSEAQRLRSHLNEQPLPITEHHAWVSRVCTYLRENLGPDFEVRFGDFSGMEFYGDGSERSKMSNSIEGRSRRLNEFMAELGR
jgi:hypothetical protein